MARVRGWYGGLILLLGAIRVAVPVTRPVITSVIVVVSIGAIELGLRRLRPERAAAWRCLQVALVVLAAGDILYLLFEADAPLSAPYPAPHDVITIAGYLLLSAALFWLGLPAPPEREETSLIDAISLTLAASLVVWLAVVRPIVEDQALSTAGLITATLAMLGYIAVLAASVRLILGWRRNAAVVILTLALLAFLISEAFYGYQLVGSDYAFGRRADLGFLVLLGGCGLAALTPSMREMASPEVRRHSLTRVRLALIAIALLVAPGLLMVEAARGPVKTGFAIGTTGALVSVLVLIRLSISGRAYRARAARERAVRVASQAMVSAVKPGDVIAGTRNALHSLVPTVGLVDLELVNQSEVDAPPRTVVPVGPGRRGQYVVPLSGSDAALVFVAPMRVLIELADLLGSLADQAALALQRISLAEIAGAEERERYFRALVLSSTDAILISRDGRIEYATPSAEPMFGRSIIGERFNDVVRRPEDPNADPQWPDVVDSAEGVIRGPHGDVAVVVHRRDLTRDPSVRGIVTTLRDVTAERELQRDLAYRASHDELTGMVNARSWGETLEEEQDRRRGVGNGVAVIFVDLDEFKDINDRYGHPTGDQVLAEMARRIRECVRAGDVAARVGGDEFAVLLRGLPNVDDARAIAQRMAEVLSQPTVVGSIPIECRASIGLAYSEGEEPVEVLVRQADTALYEAKEQGKGRWAEYSPSHWRPPGGGNGGGRRGRR
ncbi:MAG: GGDEF domain-containing protein [Micromonosporaceae bacterium]|nr:GGDEF domain-containing protein [Micromonosporaceae bacterium]